MPNFFLAARGERARRGHLPGGYVMVVALNYIVGKPSQAKPSQAKPQRAHALQHPSVHQHTKQLSSPTGPSWRCPTASGTPASRQRASGADGPGGGGREAVLRGIADNQMMRGA